MARVPTGGDELTAAEEIRVQEIQALADTSAAEALGKSSGSVVKVTRAAALGADDNYVTDAEKVVIGNTSGANTGDSATPAETATTIGVLIGGAGDATPNDTDFVATSLTAAGILKKITWTNVKAFLKTYFDTLYSAIGHNHSGVYQPADSDLDDLAAAGRGTSGQVYTSNGVGAAPTFQTAAGGGGDLVVWKSASDAVVAGNASISFEMTSYYYQRIEMTDAVNSQVLFSVKVPAGATSISSIKFYYLNEIAGTKNLQFYFSTSHINTDAISAAEIDTTNTLTTYATGTTQNRWESISAPADSFNGLTNIDADDIINIMVSRNSIGAGDTYNAVLNGVGLLVTFV